MVESSSRKELTRNGVEAEGHPNLEPYVGMEFESEEAAKAYYSTYATHLGFVMRVDAFLRSMCNGELVWHRLVCNKEGFSKSRQNQNGQRKCRAIREGCKAMIIVKKEQSEKWVVAKLVKEHNHPLVGKPANTHIDSILYQTPSLRRSVLSSPVDSCGSFVVMICSLFGLKLADSIVLPQIILSNFEESFS
uniref:Protein FAR1-RELATED SEQUENCE 5-like n=1 Tax=Nicotiana tabacum TaxID=4097 RepID=A0A1S4AK73_TOBAC|nr:PREDICTED: protein FAR1-RELATED SEQUENCE 5-like [Nicotiana tabacum]